MIRSIATLAMIAASGAATAQEWTGSVTLYGWLPAMETTATIDRPLGGSVSADVSTSATDILDALNFGFFGAAEARRGRLGLFGDVFYTDLGVSQTGPGGLRQSVGADLFMFTGAAAWRVWDDGRGFLDALGGGRVVSLDSEVSVGAASATKSTTFFDPLVGVRAGYALTERVSVLATGNIGGFGVGSELTWEAYAGFSYAISDRVSTELGYRYLSIDYESGRKEIDMQMFGPVAALTVRF